MREDEIARIKYNIAKARRTVAEIKLRALVKNTGLTNDNILRIILLERSVKKNEYRLQIAEYEGKMRFYNQERIQSGVNIPDIIEPKKAYKTKLPKVPGKARRKTVSRVRKAAKL